LREKWNFQISRRKRRLDEGDHLDAELHGKLVWREALLDNSQAIFTLLTRVYQWNS